MKPEDKEMQLDIIRRQLGLSEAGEELSDLFDGLLASALMHSNRTSTPDALLKLVRDAVCAAWRRRGDEAAKAIPTKILKPHCTKISWPQDCGCCAYEAGK